MTDDGNQNALTHGAFAEAVILPGEDAKEFRDLHDALVDEWKPAGPTEHDAISNIANGIWRKRRIRRYRQSEVTKFEAKTSAEHQRTTNSIDELKKILDDANSKTELPKEWIDYFNRYSPREKYHSHEAWISAVGRRLEKGILALKTKANSAPKVEKVYANEECVIQELATEERIDAMIDKNIKRLAQAKTVKEIVFRDSSSTLTIQPLKQISAPTIQVGPTANEGEGIRFLNP